MNSKRVCADLDLAELFYGLITPPAGGFQLILHVLHLALQLLLPCCRLTSLLPLLLQLRLQLTYLTEKERFYDFNLCRLKLRSGC